MKNKVYIFPCDRRFAGVSHIPRIERPVIVWGLGLFFGANTEEEFTQDNMKRYLVGSTQTSVTIIAKDIYEALSKFYEIPGTMQKAKYSALELSDSERRPILEYPPCDYYRFRGNFLVCSAWSEDGESLDNCIDCVAYSPEAWFDMGRPDGCPVSKEDDQEYEDKRVSGMYVRTFKPFFHQTEEQ